MTMLFAELLIFSFIINLCFFIAAFLLKTDKLTDLSYSLTFILLIFWLGGQMSFSYSPYQWTIFFIIIVWALRLGSYLFTRIHRMGADARFDHIRNRFISFLSFWLMQAITVSIILLPVAFASQAVKLIHPILFYVGISLSVLGITLETFADMQKYRFKIKHPDRFINTGLWKKIRHPNYTGELMMWYGIWIACSSMLEFNHFILAFISPLWISLIIILFSGIPPLQEQWNKKYGQDPSFQSYLKQSWKLIPYLY